LLKIFWRLTFFGIVEKNKAVDWTKMKDRELIEWDLLVTFTPASPTALKRRLKSLILLYAISMYLRCNGDEM
jgi:hypothetical protein